jgi:hypothetical protein
MLLVRWQREDAKITLNVTLPLGTTGTVVVPKPCSNGTRETAVVMGESGRDSIEAVEGIIGGPRDDQDHLTVKVGSGSYSFSVHAKIKIQ